MPRVRAILGQADIIISSVLVWGTWPNVVLENLVETKEIHKYNIFMMCV